MNRKVMPTSLKYTEIYEPRSCADEHNSNEIYLTNEQPTRQVAWDNYVKNI